LILINFLEVDCTKKVPFCLHFVVLVHPTDLKLLRNSS
jgi:hypothetical protein